MGLSIVIVNWNTKDLLRKCLESIYEAPPLVKFEVLVVDNASNDGSGEMVEKDFPEAQLIKNNTNLGFAKANNQGIKKSHGNLVLLLNSDVKILPGVLEKMVNFMAKHPEIGILGPKLIYPNGSYQLSGGHFPMVLSEFFERSKLAQLFSFSKFIGRYRMNYWDRDNGRELDWVSGAALMIRRRVIQDGGLMDENFFMHYEDIDWCYRAKAKGWKVYFIPEAKLVHLERQSTKKYPANLHFFNYRKSQLYFYQKHYSLFRSSLLRIITVFIMLLRIITLPFELMVSGRRHRKILERLKLYLAIIEMSVGRKAKVVSYGQPSN